VNPNEPPARGYVADGEAAAARLGLTQQAFEARTFDDIEPAFDAAARAEMQAVVLGGGGLFYQARTLTPQLALARHLPLCVWSSGQTVVYTDRHGGVCLRCPSSEILRQGAT
jgi:hypothetical protein